MQTAEQKRKAAEWRVYMKTHPDKYAEALRRNRINKRQKRAKDPTYGQHTAAYMREWRARKRAALKSGTR